MSEPLVCGLISEPLVCGLDILFGGDGTLALGRHELNEI